MINAPIILQLNQDRDPRYYGSVVKAIETLNRGLIDEKIWNVEVNDAKFDLSYAVQRTLTVICDRSRANRGGAPYEDWMDDFSSYCSFNQAAGRIKRLTKRAPKTIVVADYIEALREVDGIWKAIQALKPFIQKGRRPNENKTQEQVERELKNTGVCAICANRQKLDADKMVQHGYQMSGYNHTGYRLGSCFGVGYLCYELSNEANVAYQPVLLQHEKDTELALQTLRGGKIEKFQIEESGSRKADRKTTTVYRTGPTAQRFARELEYRIHNVESELRVVRIDIEINQAKIDGWKLQPLMYGRE